MWKPLLAPDAVVARGDVTRRWAVSGPDGAAFPGLTRNEADRYCEVLERHGATPARLLLAVVLDAMLSDGAGPHLLGADGLLAIALGPHPHLGGLRVCMGEGVGPGRAVGVVEDRGDGVWAWRACARVPAAEAVVALDGLAALEVPAELVSWATGLGGFASSGVNA